MNPEFANLFSTDSMSIGTETPLHQAGGSLFSFNQTASNSKALLAAREQNYDALSFMLKHNMIDDVTAHDNTNSTILHYLAADYDSNSNNKQLVSSVLAGGSASSFLNKQDHNGNTALHLAVMNGHNELAGLLIGAGCDKTMKNNDGLTVASEEQSDSESNVINTVEPDTNTNVINAIVNTFLSKSESPPEQYTYDTAQIDTKVNTDTFLDSVFGRIEQPSAQTGGAKKRSKKKSRRSRRSRSSSRSSSRSTRSTKLGRLIARQGSDIHRTVIDKILKLLKLNKDKPEDVEKARNYKAVLWNEIKKNKKLVSNLDRSVELEKMTTLAKLKKIDPKKGVAIRKASSKKREEMIKARKLESDTKSDTISATSSAPVSPTAAMARTSVSSDMDFDF